MSERINRMGTVPTGAILIRLSLPAMSSLIITATYNVVDSLFVGRFVGTEGLAAVGSNFPLFIFFIAVAILLGTGSSALISRNFGEGRHAEAQKVFSSALVLIIIFAACAIAIFVPFRRFWVALIGSLSEYSLSYFLIIALGAPFIISNLALNNIVYAEGRGSVGFSALSITSLMNIVFDWLFITQFDMAVAGAAIATVISQATGTLILLCYFVLPQSQLKIQLKGHRGTMLNIVRIGISASARTLTVVFLGLVMNRQAFVVGGELALATVSVVFRVTSLIALPAFGINQAFLPIASYNYGAGKFDRVRRVTGQSILMGFAICYTAVFFVLLFAGPLAAAFNPNQEFVARTSEGFRIVFFGTPMLIINLVSSGLYQAVGKPIQSLIIAISRVGFFKIPFILLFSSIYGMVGIWIALLIAEFFSASFGGVMMLRGLGRIKQKPALAAEAG